MVSNVMLICVRPLTEVLGTTKNALLRIMAEGAVGFKQSGAGIKNENNNKLDMEVKDSGSQTTIRVKMAAATTSLRDKQIGNFSMLHAPIA